MLKIKIGEKEFTKPFISARTLRNVMKILADSEGKELSTLEQFDQSVEIITAVFDHQFTADDLLDHFPSNEFTNLVETVMNEVMGGDGKKQITEK